MSPIFKPCLIVCVGLLASVLLPACAERSKISATPVQIINKQSRTQDQPNRVPGEYIITLRKSVNEGAVRELYAAFGVLKVTDIGKGRFLLQIQNDPGFAAMKMAGKNSPVLISIQPNFIYRSTPPVFRPYPAK